MNIFIFVFRNLKISVLLKLDVYIKTFIKYNTAMGIAFIFIVYIILIYVQCHVIMNYLKTIPQVHLNCHLLK